MSRVAIAFCLVVLISAVIANEPPKAPEPPKLSQDHHHDHPGLGSPQFGGDPSKLKEDGKVPDHKGFPDLGSKN
ncbi:hypothetical protein K1T71_010376 [Dendrolimus kikuchii]|uniref:Uncharacterized protein n=1 Tax=Dendrolimus kikuchii TaxID=765133 RepID=A0ACC1CS32_9NEOP|nr:hypothetical protein K1T71_010376 [Dendrolimus kikuchii]